MNKSALKLIYTVDKEVDLRWTAESVMITVTSDKAQTIEISVYGGEAQKVTFAEGETKAITFSR